jgi:hypothetical protein
MGTVHNLGEDACVHAVQVVAVGERERAAAQRLAVGLQQLA